MTSTPDAALAALAARLQAALPVAVPGLAVIDDEPSGDGDQLGDAGHVAVVLDDRGVPDGLNGAGPFYRETLARLECLVRGASAAERRTRLRAVLDAVEAALNADRTLGGEILGCTWEALDPQRVPVEGGADVMGEIILVTLEFETDTEL
ncbi:MAG: hypothetical protein VX463_07315 [Pseudomonadota bacterium]|nr:hypothetical protein [Pseudomonadota bacterium]